MSATVLFSGYLFDHSNTIELMRSAWLVTFLLFLLSLLLYVVAVIRQRDAAARVAVENTAVHYPGVAAFQAKMRDM